MEKKQGIGFFEKYLTIWVALCIIIGIAVGQWLPAIPQTLSKFEYANVSIPVAILIWLMIYPMMLKVDFQSVKNVGKRPKGIIVTCVTNRTLADILADKAIYHVRNSLFVLLCGFQSLYTCRISRRIFSRGGIIGGCTLYSYGVRVELPY